MGGGYKYVCEESDSGSQNSSSQKKQHRKLCCNAILPLGCHPHGCPFGPAVFAVPADPSSEHDDSLMDVTPPSPNPDGGHLRLRSRRVRRPFDEEEDAAILQGVWLT